MYIATQKVLGYGLAVWLTLPESYTLEELKLQGINICDGVVFSQYSWAQCFAINSSDFGNAHKFLVVVNNIFRPEDNS